MFARVLECLDKSVQHVVWFSSCNMLRHGPIMYLLETMENVDVDVYRCHVCLKYSSRSVLMTLFVVQRDNDSDNFDRKRW